MSQTGTCQEDQTLQQLTQQAVQAIQKVLDTPPRERNQVVDFGERAIVRLRDCLILRCRQEEAEPTLAGPTLARLRAALDQANVALSLITGVEYPGAGIQEKPMQEAMEVLKALNF